MGRTASTVLLLLAAACAGAGRDAVRAPAPLVWQAAHGRDHPLAGRIREVAAGRWIDEDALLDALAVADLVLVGERHDNPDHHALQARIVAGLVARGHRPAVAFEMLDAGDAPAIAGALATEGSAAALREAVAWDASGWPPFALYAPLFEAVLRARLPIVAANLPRSERHAIGHGGIAALPPARRAALGLEAPADPGERRALAEQIREVHCGHAPEAMLERMVDVQRAWNAQLARALADAAAATPDGSALLVAGNEHVRRDRGTPRWLARFAPQVRVATVGLLELDPSDPATDPSAGAPFDYVWLTPRVDLADPCQKHRDTLEGLEGRRGGAE